MATTYRVTDAELTQVATAIRAKTGSTANLRWPDGYVTAIDSIEVDPMIELQNLGIDPILENNSWEVIGQVAQSGLADMFWDIGDSKIINFKSKTIGTVTNNGPSINGGNYIIDNYSLFIVHFNCPINKTIPDKNIIFMGFKTVRTYNSHQVQSTIAVTDSSYGNMCSSTKNYSLNHSNNPGVYSWWHCDFRYDILGATSSQPTQYLQQKTTASIGYNATQETINNPVPNTLMDLLPDDFRNILKLQTHYINKVGKGQNISQYGLIVDAISIPSVYNYLGSRYLSSTTSRTNYFPLEAEHQTQFSYFLFGNSLTEFYYFRYYQNQYGTNYGPTLYTTTPQGETQYSDDTIMLQYIDSSIPYYTGTGRSGVTIAGFNPIFKV